ncbi:Na+/H+ antiporter NhaC [Chitinispirillales bacterium ANBcel5]|uniref:Na+/H+ antiporter NhaC n=1 Tax=Cellulosispirillum alkaliphilum TaxID=3039283 RepID=UPI002A521CE3|nr:Na+/H+ antiporter NhaC [Chitinispirillales bacterium ANBcel5]
MTSKKVTPPAKVALIPVLVVGVSLGLSVFVYDAQPHIPLFFGAVAAGLTAIVYGYSWETISNGFTRSIARAIPSLIILLIIGMIIGVWIASGIVPAMMYYGFNVLVPAWFLPSILIICSIMSVVTGSSWTTAGTIGVAAIGIGQGLGIPAPAVAGAVVSGAFFGDKLSPLSDSTNLTPSVLGLDLYVHIKHMLYTTIPSFILALIMFTVLGFILSEGAANTEHMNQYQELIRENFKLSFWLLIPPVAVITLIVFKIPAIPSLVAGVVLGGVMMVTVQGQSSGEFFTILYDGFSISTGWEEMDNLLSRGGMESMYSVVALAIMALSFGGIMNHCNMLKSLVDKMSSLVNKAGSLVLTTLVTSVFINIFGANQYLAVIIPGQMYEQAYKKLNLKMENLSRALEGGGTLTAPLISWNSSGVFMYSVLAVSPLAYFPYAFVCWLTPLVVAVFGFFNITMTKTETKKQSVSQKEKVLVSN